MCALKQAGEFTTSVYTPAFCWQESFIEADFHLLTWAVGGLKTGSDGSMYGHACASNSIAVAAIDVVR